MLPLFTFVELMLLGLISLLLAQWANWISQICVNSSLFSSKFYLCSETDFDTHEHFTIRTDFSFLNETDIPPEGLNSLASHQCGAVKSMMLLSILNCAIYMGSTGTADEWILACCRAENLSFHRKVSSSSIGFYLY